MAFKKSSPEVPPPATPEELYGELPHRTGAVGSLWLHQGDLLRQYAGAHRDTPDLALELPTGTGKTLPGLLIADWSRRVRRARVAYACPTQQLVRQVAATAEREGIPAVVLVGRHTDWPVADESRYEGAEAVAITTYSTVFNSSPKLAQPDVLLFDDAHAGEQYVAEAYSVAIRRRGPAGTYRQLLEAIAPALDGMFVARLQEETPDPSVHQQMRLVVPLRQPGMVDAVNSALSDLPYNRDERFQFAMIRHALASSLIYVTYSQILIRPIVPPTEENPLFTGARQRVYLSATLGEGGELERSFGRAPIVRLALPETSPTPRSGRRFFVFPELIEDVDARQLAAEVVAMAGKALVLAPDTQTAAGTAAELAQPGWPVLGTGDVADGMKPFADLEHATCGLASRYDGLDLPGAACRAVVLEGTPDQDNLQERFLTQRVRAGSALAERVRTRVVQGAGRCTRGPDDWALVVVLGADLTRYLLRPETLRALAPELQAEVQFGVDNSRDASKADVLDNVAAFLAQNDVWHDEAEPALADLRRRAERRLAPGTEALAASAALELEAGQMAAAGRWADASRVAADAARALGLGGDATRGYRALWLYLTALWTDQAAADAGQAGGRATATALIEQAEKAAKPGTWTREMAALPDVEREALGAADTNAVAMVAALAARTPAGTHTKKITDMFAALAETEAAKYEPGLTILGTLLGAEARKPPGSGRCDSTWCWDELLWLAVEAKSDHEPAGLVPHKDVRQANDQLRLLAGDRKTEAIPPDSATVIVSPKPAIDPNGAAGADAHVHFTHPDTIVALARDAQAAWEEIMAGRTGLDDAALRRLVEGALTRRGILATQVLDRLTHQPVSTLQSAA